MSQDLLFEIGTEEIPARFFAGAIAQLKDKAEAALRDARLSHEVIQVLATPRRLALLVHGLADRQTDLELQVKGPAKKAAFDAEGKPTRAAEGFARGQGVDVSALKVVSTEAGEYVYAFRTEIGRPALEVLPGLLSGLVTGLEFPKSMRWGDSTMRFARPIKWILALYGEEVVPFQVDGVPSGRSSLGHRFLGPRGPVEIARPGEYVERLRSAFVMVDQDERRRVILDQVNQVARDNGGRVPVDEDLLEEVTFLVEWPSAFAGAFDSGYLRIPAEVLVTTMREHQRYFPVLGADDKLLPRFIAVRNGTLDHIDIVRAGNEKVLRARLADASFFYEEDRKVPLENRLQALKNVVFQEKLGTIYNKVERIERLTGIIADALNLNPETRRHALRAAHLAKADLVTNMVKEFTELQGVMGREYAKLAGEPDEVATAIFEHYLPRGAGDQLPETIPGMVVALADKIDTIAGSFSVGLIPTGSADPYALRRQALGVVGILAERGLRLSLSSLVRSALDGYNLGLDEAAKVKTTSEVLEFFKGRLKGLMQERGIRYDAVDAVLAAGTDDVADAIRRAEALADSLARPGFPEIMAAFRRVANLGTKAESTDIDPSLLEETPERELYEAFQSFVSAARADLEAGEYRAFYAKAPALKGPVDGFLDKILVMVEDPAVRRNRLALLRTIADFLSGPADLAKLVV